MIGLCTDSNAQLPEELRRRYAVRVVPLTITIDGEDFLEGVDLDADQFYDRLSKGPTSITTAAPGPGRLAAGYADLIERGATEILSVHIGSDVSGTVNAARLASAEVGVPVRIVDTGTASFAIACCLWEAAAAIEGGANLEDAARVAESVAGRLTNVFVVGGLDLARRGGRLAPGTEDRPDVVPVLALVDGQVRRIGEVDDIEQAVDTMAAAVVATGAVLRVGVGIADAGASAIGEALASRLEAAPEVLEVVRYRVGPSVGVHTGPGTAGACAYPTR